MNTEGKSVTINKRLKQMSMDELEKLNKSELIEHITRLESHNAQLKNLLQKKLNGSYLADEKEPSEPNTKKFVEKQQSKRKFDFSNTPKRHVLLKLLYFGWDYQGFACQEDSNNTIEHHLFEALIRTCLIESRSTSNYHRCGRTDKGVSAFCQVISIDLRSKLETEKQMNADSLKAEIDYCGILNRILPPNIQCIAWMPLRSTTFSARFDCAGRTYRYYFPSGSLNIGAMQTACGYLERHADFRNFCKMDVQNGVTNFVRHIQKATIELYPHEVEDNTGYTMYYLEITSNAFLFHQIRCIMSVLFLIGQGLEEPSVINELLNVAKNPCKPQYSPAIGLPLNLFQCEFQQQTTPGKNCDDFSAAATSWIYNKDTLLKLIENLQAQWMQSNVKTTMQRNVLDHLMGTFVEQFQADILKTQPLTLQVCKQSRQYQKLLNRKRCESLENRIEHFVKKQRLVIQNNSDPSS